MPNISLQEKLIRIGRGILKYLIIILLLLFLIYLLIMMGNPKPAENISYGVTFSPLFANQLGLDWQKTYLAILDDLQVDKLRLIAYWPLVETEDDNYIFSDLDWQIQQAQQRNAEVILVVGRRVPRWPECHIPEWAKNLPEKQQQTEVLELIERLIVRYRDYESIKYWQVENEPFLRHFGECPKPDGDFMDQEIALVKSLDNRQIILTTSGELSLWSEPASRTDILGTTLYRTVWNRYLKRHMTYPITPVFYARRAALMKWLYGVEEVFVCELAAEPWGQKQIYESTLDEQFASMNIEEFRKNVDYAQKTGLQPIYFWGAEWWYWLKENHQIDDFWQEAKALWTEGKDDNMEDNDKYEIDLE
jgi:hypothetical protein